ncbi:lysophospholipid acyltransferase family protein [Geomonas subterranea]|uniref:Lysophospholipid acyltransferase family protein n=1 Tax=Geomonas subterranea TaxID=2847989 RepID=A0ABX8LIZ4_9BACT|nr:MULTISPECIES: lysophospholipid acyltransferase family protein [Geomonas]QXE90685.1 lysophospholipid acyltransferase family protein [Geomonas subterranea]QXM11234.1 lysophospholipid acyltransferase family protein [Geomonas subterranea]
MFKQLRWYLEMVFFVVISSTIALLPNSVALSAGRLLGRTAFLFFGRRRRIAIANLEASLPFLERQPGWRGGTARELARGVFENLGCCIVEVCKIYRGSGQELIDNVEFRGVEHFDAAFAKGKGLIFITAHSGNWELLALAFGVRRHELSVVARRQDNPHLNRMVERIRKSYGNGLIYKDGALRAMFSALRKREVVGLLIDQAVQSEWGILANFLGRPAWTMRMPSLIARKSGAPLLPAFIHREGNKSVITIHPEYQLSAAEDPEVAAAEDANGLNRYIEEYVVQHPGQWYWVHKRWKNAPPAA